MGRLTKRNRAKYRRRAYAAGMRRTQTLHPVVVSPATRDERERGPFDGKRAA
jgi:hypothetical protein